jgi:asparagine synthase (glutamine-hydrolysing)
LSNASRTSVADVRPSTLRQKTVRHFFGEPIQHMPGITGIISHRLSAENRVQLSSMIKSLLHEDFYKSGSLVNEVAGVAVGWVSHPGSFADCMPVWNEDKNILLVFSGEDYQNRAPIEKLRGEGHEFTASNASYLVHLYEQLGLQFLEHINGWFSGLILDLREKRAFLFNDRFGVGRICYLEAEAGFYFSSEAKSLLKIFPHLRSLDVRSLAEIFSCGSVLQNRTLFSGISLLPGGSVWSFSQSQPAQKDKYFEPRLWEEQSPLGEAEYYEQLKETWRSILPNYFPENQRAGLSLTGGVDSRMILAWAPCPPGDLPCYTFSGRYRDCNDVKLARRLAELTHQPYQTIPIDTDFTSQFPSLVEKVAYIGEGNLDASGSIDLFVQREARKIAPVRVTGTNGGELLRRLVMFKPTRLTKGLFVPEVESSLREAESTYAEELDCHRLSFTAFKQTPWHMNSKFLVERSQLTTRLPFCDNELVRLSYQAPVHLAQEPELALRLIGDGNPSLARIGTDRAFGKTALPGMGRARHLLEEFTFKAEHAYDHGMPQWLARMDHNCAGLHLEKLFLGRHKFHHFRVYYRDELSSHVRDILLDPRTLSRPFMRKRALEDIVRGHAAGYRNYTLEIHRLLTIELVQRQLIEQG